MANTPLIRNQQIQYWQIVALPYKALPTYYMKIGGIKFGRFLQLVHQTMYQIKFHAKFSCYVYTVRKLIVSSHINFYIDMSHNF